MSMSRRCVPILKEAALAAAALLLLGPQVIAGGGGGRYHSTSRPITRSEPAPAVVAQAVVAPRAVSVVVMLSQAAKKPVYVNLRGPDGRVRRFLVEGGRAAIEDRQVVLRPGQSVTIHVAGR